VQSKKKETTAEISAEIENIFYQLGFRKKYENIYSVVYLNVLRFQYLTIEKMKNVLPLKIEKLGEK
jgi:hypothetical protein